MPTIVGPILNSAGQPASGILRVTATEPFESGAAGLVTRGVATVTVVNGSPLLPGAAPFTLPVTPEGVALRLEEDLDGARVARYDIEVPDLATITYRDLILSYSTWVPGSTFGVIDGGAP